MHIVRTWSGTILDSGNLNYRSFVIGNTLLCVEYVPRQGKKHFIQKEDNVKRIITSTFVKYECLQFLYVKYRYL